MFLLPAYNPQQTCRFLCIFLGNFCKFHIVTRLDIVSYKSVYSLCIIIKPATLKAPPSTILLFPADFDQRQYNFTCLQFLGLCHLFDSFVLFVVTPVIFALSSLIVVYDFSLTLFVNLFQEILTS